MDSNPSTSASGHCEQEIGSDDVFDETTKSAPPRSSNPAPSDVDVDVDEVPLREEDYAVGVFTSIGLVRPDQMLPPAAASNLNDIPTQQPSLPPQDDVPSNSYGGNSSFQIPATNSYPTPSCGPNFQACQYSTASFQYPNAPIMPGGGEFIQVASSAVGFSQQNILNYPPQGSNTIPAPQVVPQPVGAYATLGASSFGHSATNLPHFNLPVGKNLGAHPPQAGQSSMVHGYSRQCGPQAVPYCLPRQENPYRMGYPARYSSGLGYMGFNPLPLGFDWRHPQRPAPHPESPVAKMKRIVADSTGPEFERRIASTFTSHPRGYGGPTVSNAGIADDMEEFGGGQRKGKGRGKSKSKSSQFHAGRPSLVFSTSALKRDHSTRVDFDQTVSLSAIDPERTSLVDINQRCVLKANFYESFGLAVGAASAVLFNAEKHSGGTQTLLTNRPHLLRLNLESALAREELNRKEKSQGIFTVSCRSIQSNEGVQSYLSLLAEDLTNIRHSDIKGIGGRDIFELYLRSTQVVFDAEYINLPNCPVPTIESLPQPAKTSTTQTGNDEQDSAPCDVVKQNLSQCRSVESDAAVVAEVQNLRQHSVASRKLLCAWLPLMSRCEKLSSGSAIPLSKTLTIPSCTDRMGRPVQAPRLTCGNVWTKKKPRVFQTAHLDMFPHMAFTPLDDEELKTQTKGRLVEELINICQKRSETLWYQRHDVANPAVLKELEDLLRAEVAVMHHLVARRMTHSDYHQNVYQRYCTYYHGLVVDGFVEEEGNRDEDYAALKNKIA